MFSDGESKFFTQSKFKDGSEFVYTGDVLSNILNIDGDNAINPNCNLKCDVFSNTISFVNENIENMYMYSSEGKSIFFCKVNSERLYNLGQY